MLLNVFSTAVNAILPIVLIIAFGYYLRQTGSLTDDFVKQGNKLMFRYLLPCMLFVNTYSIDSFADIPLRLMLYTLAMLVGNFLLGWLVVPHFTKDPRRKGVLLQSTFRSNTAVIGIPLAQALGGSAAVAVATVSVAMCVPVLNILAVISLSLFVHDGEKTGVKKLLSDILHNPLILGIGAGFVCILLRTLQRQLFGEVLFSVSEDLTFFYSALSKIGSIATPFALLVLGGQFSFSSMGDMKKEIIVGTAWRLVVAPVLGLGGAYLLTRAGMLSCGSAEYPSLIALFATPVAVSSATMAGQMGSDEQLGTQLVVWTSLMSIITLFLIVCILVFTGLLAI